MQEVQQGDKKGLNTIFTNFSEKQKQFLTFALTL